MSGQRDDFPRTAATAVHGPYSSNVADATHHGTWIGASLPARAFLVVHQRGEGSRVLDLADGGEITFGRSRTAVVSVKHDDVSRLHTAVRRRGDVLEVEDLGSRNGTWLNGQRIDGVRRLAAGDELGLGPIHVVVNVTSALRRSARVVDATEGDRRLAAEVDRATRYHRPTTLALVRVSDDAALDAIVDLLRPMDLVADHVGDEYVLILPELDRAEATAAIAAITSAVRATGTDIAIGAVTCPDQATTCEAAIARMRAGLRVARRDEAPAEPAAPTGPVVRDPAMRRVYALAEKIADSSITVLIFGETGVGKELVVDAIHRASARRAEPLVKLNCAALTETLLESEMFGHERGAFTGADARKRGFFEAADGGTLFLDEIGELPLSLQAKLLRVLERKVITRVGSTAEIAVDVRIIGATHRDLEAEVRGGRFRSDLLFRIGGFTIAIPPLRDRTAEILPLAEQFARAAAAERGRPPPLISPEARDALIAYPWPGNVRELENAIERALVLCDDTIGLLDLPERVRVLAERLQPITATADIQGQLSELERAAITGALASNANNQTRAARALGLSRRALIYKMEKYGLKPPPSRADR